MSANSIGNKGFSVIEIIVAVFVVVVTLVSFLGIMALSLKSSGLVTKVNEANFLTQEIIEAIRGFRDSTDWDSNGLGTLVIGADYFLNLTETNPPSWAIVLGEESVNNFTRKVIFEKVSRDSFTKDIEDFYDPGNDDPNTRKATITVSWSNKETKIITYFTNWNQ